MSRWQRGLSTGELFAALAGHTDGARCFALAEAQGIRLTGPTDRVARQRGLRTGELLATLRGRADYVTCFALAEAQGLRHTGSGDCTART